MFSILKTGFWQQLEQWDQWLLIKLNSGMANPFFDNVMPFIREPIHWAPLYLFLGAFVLLNFKGRGAWWILFFIVTVALTDMGGTYIFKHNFLRIRPCQDPDLVSYIRVLTDRCVGYSFISNHAANHFGMATFFFITFRPVLKKWRWLAFVWAALIAYAQIYIGLHYPSDVIVGMTVGLLAGLLTGTIFNKRHGFVIFDNQPTVSS